MSDQNPTEVILKDILSIINRCTFVGEEAHAVASAQKFVLTLLKEVQDGAVETKPKKAKGK